MWLIHSPGVRVDGKEKKAASVGGWNEEPTPHCPGSLKNTCLSFPHSDSVRWVLVPSPRQRGAKWTQATQAVGGGATTETQVSLALNLCSLCCSGLRCGGTGEEP